MTNSPSPQADTNSPVNPIGLIAGNGKLPVVFAKEAKKLNYSLVAVGFKGETAQELRNIVDRIYWVNLGEWNKIIKFFQKLNVKKALMLGLVKHTHIFENIKFDRKTKEIWNKLKDKRANTLLKTAVSILTNAGINVISPTTFLKFFFIPSGILTQSRPTKKEWQDIEFGYKIAKNLARLDIGQTVVVKDKSVLAVEAMEGTDKCILRAGKINENGIIVTKVARPKQDMRFDLPVIGLNTINVLKKVKARVLACESRKTILLDKEKLIQWANKNKLVIVGI